MSYLSSLMTDGLPVLDPQEPRSDCCVAHLVRVGDEMYACEACGQLCSDGSCA
jgi:hypothetical protein